MDMQSLDTGRAVLRGMVDRLCLDPTSGICPNPKRVLDTHSALEASEEY